MKLTVRDLLKQDLPPTNADAQMRKKHTIGSVDHNIRHFVDHGDGVIESLRKLYTVDSKEAGKQAQRVIKTLQDSLKKAQDFVADMKASK
jgi:hypothetical protein